MGGCISSMSSFASASSFCSILSPPGPSSFLSLSPTVFLGFLRQGPSAALGPITCPSSVPPVSKHNPAPGETQANPGTTFPTANGNGPPQNRRPPLFHPFQAQLAGPLFLAGFSGSRLAARVCRLVAWPSTTSVPSGSTRPPPHVRPLTTTWSGPRDW